MIEAGGERGFRKHVFFLLSGVAGFCISAATGGAAEWPPSLSIASLDGSTGFMIDGTAAGDTAGHAISSAGDFNGDGFDDLVVGAYTANTPGSNSGAAYVVFGKATGFASSTNLSALDGSNGFRLAGIVANDLAGDAVSAGDVNGDGLSDLIIGARYASGSATNSGAVYVVFGTSGAMASSISLSTLDGINGYKLEGAANLDSIGGAVSTAGDVNGDSFDDLVIGARFVDINGYDSGASYVVFGKATGFASTVNVSALDGSTGFRLEGAAADDLSGRAVSAAGDVNDDGFADVIVGADGVDGNGAATGDNHGASYVVFGKAAGFASTINLSSLDGTTGFRLDGGAVDDKSGRSVAGAGDVNGDGIDDLLVGAFGVDVGGAYAGATYVVFGRTTAFASAINIAALDGSTGFRIDGAAADDYSGRAVSGAGDVNGDGFADIVIGAPLASPGASGAGSGYVVFGKASGFASAVSLSTIDGGNGFRVDGVTMNDANGLSVAAAGDVNSDGLADVMLGAPATDNSGGGSGSIYVIFGRLPDAAVSRIGSAAAQYISGGPLADSLSGLDGNDVLEGRGGGDRLNGGAGSNTASYAHSASGVKANLASPGINTGAAKSDSYINIQNLQGSAFADNLAGNGKVNRLIGGRGKDTLKGNGENDVFVYGTANDSPAGGASADVITDFNPGSSTSAADRIDLSAIDAKTSVGGNQAFTFRGTKAFNGVGQVRLKKSGADVIVQGNTGGSTAPEFEIVLKGLASNIGRITVKDFKL